MKYEVTLSWVYKDTVTVEADNEDDALILASEEAEPEFAYLDDSSIVEIDEGEE